MLKPYGVFSPKPLPPSPAPAPAEEKPKKTSSDDSPVSQVKSGAVPTLISKLNGVVSIAVSVVAAAALSFL